MQKLPSVFNKFIKRYSRNLKHSFDFGIGGYLINEKEFTSRDIEELKTICKNNSSLLNNKDIDLLFEKLKSIFIKQFSSDVKRTINYRQRCKKQKEQEQKLEAARKLQKKIEKSVINKLSAEEKALLRSTRYLR